MMVHMSGYFDTKLGGTAGVILMTALVPAMLIVWDESFFVPFSHTGHHLIKEKERKR